MSLPVLRPTLIRPSAEIFCNICHDKEDKQSLWAHELPQNDTTDYYDLNRPWSPQNDTVDHDDVNHLWILQNDTADDDDDLKHLWSLHNDKTDYDDLNRPWICRPPRMFHYVHKECQRQWVNHSLQNNCIVCKTPVDLSEMFPWTEKAQEAGVVALQHVVSSAITIGAEQIAAKTVTLIATRTPMMVDFILCRIINHTPSIFLRQQLHRINPTLVNVVKISLAFGLSEKISRMLYAKIIGRNEIIQNPCLFFFSSTLKTRLAMRLFSKDPIHRTCQIVFLEAIGLGIASFILGRAYTNYHQ